MNKGLEALEILKHTTDLSNPLYGWTNELNTIETELKNYESLDKERKLLIEEKLCLLKEICKLSKENEKQDEILRIIREKRVNINVLVYCDDYNAYNDMMDGVDRELTQAEFDLLKEWLK